MLSVGSVLQMDVSVLFCQAEPVDQTRPRHCPHQVWRHLHCPLPQPGVNSVQQTGKKLSGFITQLVFVMSSNLCLQAGALVHIYTDGSVLLTHGGTEMGQGLHTKMIQVPEFNNIVALFKSCLFYNFELISSIIF